MPRRRSKLGGHFAGTGVEEDRYDEESTGSKQRSSLGIAPYKGRLKDPLGTQAFPYAGHMSLNRYTPSINLPHEKKEDWEKLSGKVKSYNLNDKK